MASLTRWTWVWVNSRSWWWTGRPGMLWFMGSQRVEHDWATELNCTHTSGLKNKTMTCHRDKKFWGCILDELYWKKQIFFSTCKKSRNHKKLCFLVCFPFILGPYIGLSILEPDPGAAIIWFWFNWNVCLQLLGVYACRALVSAYALALKFIYTQLLLLSSLLPPWAASYSLHHKFPLLPRIFIVLS